MRLREDGLLEAAIKTGPGEYVAAPIDKLLVTLQQVFEANADEHES
jgi:hypothetical protein